MRTMSRALASTTVGMVLAVGAQGQERMTYDELPQAVKETLATKFPGAEITSAAKELEDGEVIYDIEMTRDGRKHEMDAREDGSIVNFENEIPAGDLPAAVVAAVKAMYPDATINEAMEVMVVEDGSDVVKEYEVLIETTDGRETERTLSLDGEIIE